MVLRGYDIMIIALLCSYSIEISCFIARNIGVLDKRARMLDKCVINSDVQKGLYVLGYLWK